MQQESSSLEGHLKELRKRIISVLIVFLAAIAGSFFTVQPLLGYMKRTPPASTLDWNVFSPMDAIRIYIQFAFMIALIVMVPFILYQVWSFVAPALTVRERKATLRYIPVVFCLILIGFAFAYFVVFPMALHFSTSLTHKLGLNEMYGIHQYFSFMFGVLLPVSLVFEFPLVVVFLTHLQLVTPAFLRKQRKTACLLFVIMASIITPPDIVSPILLTIPLLALYEISIWLSAAVIRKQQQLNSNKEVVLHG
ncbi:twin-arginine translocase subunit TatC [Paenibacillus piri]|uniref:Sec-independent protein translocase protein TatC n=1 Tax=Paenibacillus piri TaxID=2547395 RepID=A0A4R5KT38_9BACL|nr:twin-arginine translocase subunit TatC [Paenibacillus piri]TDF98806.1 twin-arginine translocase subunit TatC [Paenibacillus piri]